MKCIISLSVTLLLLASQSVWAEDDVKTKFYDFDDLLINGNYQKPQVLYTDSKKKVRFEQLLRLKQDFLYRLEETAKDPSLR